MTDALRLRLVQLPLPTADPAANAAAIARHLLPGADLVLTPGLSLCGGMPLDLARRADYRQACDAALATLAARTAEGGPALVVGAPWLDGDRLHEAAVLLEGGRVAARRARHLPDAPFLPGPAPGPIAFRGVRLGLAAGEDALDAAVAETLSETGAEILLGLAAAPFAPGVAARRMQAAIARVVETGLPFLLLNGVGGPDEAVCDGGSFVLNADRALAVQMIRFDPDRLDTAWRPGPAGWACDPTPPEADCASAEEELWRALMLGVAGRLAGRGDHLGRFRAAALAPLTGDPADALAAILAVDALGGGNVLGVALDGDLEEAEAFARALGIGFEARPIAPALAALGGALAPALGGPPEGEVAAALAARLRGVALRALAEAGGMLLLSGLGRVGAPSGEADLAPFRDLPRTRVLELARWRNATRPDRLRAPQGPLIPAAMLDRPPPAGRLDEPARRRLPPGVILGPASRVPRYPLSDDFRDPDA